MQPYRLEFFGDEIDEIRTFDLSAQTSTGKVQSCEITPACEAQITSLLLDYLPKDTLIVFDDLAALEDHLVLLKNYSIDPLFGKYPHLYLTPQSITDLSPNAKTHFEIFGKTIPIQREPHKLQRCDINLYDVPQSMQITFVCANASEERAIKTHYPKMKAEFKTGNLSSGLIAGNHIIYPYSEISKRPAQRRTKWRTSYHTPPAEFHELAIGDLVVHFHNGVGKYLGIETRPDHTGTQNDFLIIEYSSNSKLYVPLSQAHLVSRYIGAREEHPPLDTLGTKKWHTARTRAQKAIVGYARDMLELQAQRELLGSEPYPPDSDEMQLFEAAFPYTPTDDQLSAIHAIKSDMMSNKAMDRLICGDVGYGKTEVAMRAAFKAVLDGGKQVAVLVPTTVLALQHYESFSDRMREFPVRVAHLSRFITPKAAKKTIQEIEEGKIDIIIGTHRLVSKDLTFKNLGLIVIDEEQRFGVRVKEHLKKFKQGVNCLTLSATPIPRTLYMSLTGARDLSTINTPPQDRLPIKTILCERQNQTIKNGILRELARDGQIFFIHNRVDTIFKIAKDLQELVPHAKIVVAHGQMDADELDTIFHTFKSGQADILVATTLIENGIDIPNANTIFIDRAHQFGLSDLYQLRGRVGRFSRAAYAYFLIPERRALPEPAQKRLQALVESSSFGGGMKLAMRDLEIRGSGDILGTQQSGHLSQIGFHLYCKLLKKAMHALKTKKSTSFIETKLEFPFNAQLPTTYIPETSLRLEIYHRLGDATADTEVEKITSELIDRFGKPPIETEWLLALTHIRIQANAQNYTLLKFTSKNLYTEQQRGSKLLKTTHPLPPITSPKNLVENASKMLT
ncbi:MAG: transcription-repair coupling factor [Chlamydiales bacterium]|nr:transcription-repair coupling factor [Chlamydiales bacterium]